MDDYRLSTPEQVDITYTVSGFGTRFIALAIDTLIQGALLLVLLLSMADLYRSSPAFREWYVAFVILACALIKFGYFLFCELLMRGRTPGKAAAGIRVLRVDGRPVDTAGILLRNLVRLIDYLPGFYTVGVIAMFVNPNSRRLGDLAGGTVVVVDRKRRSVESVLAAQSHAQAGGPLTDREYAVARDFLARSSQLAPETRQRLAMTIAMPIYDRLGVHPVQRTAPEAFLYGLLYPAGAHGEQPDAYGQFPQPRHTLTGRDYAVIRDFFARCAQLAPADRARLAADIAGPLYDRLGVPHPHRGDPEAFLWRLLPPDGMGY